MLFPDSLSTSFKRIFLAYLFLLILFRLSGGSNFGVTTLNRHPNKLEFQEEASPELFRQRWSSVMTMEHE